MTRRMPDGTVLQLHRNVRVRGGGATLIGGAPVRAIHLAPTARERIHDGRITVRDTATRRLAEHLLAAGAAQPVLDTLPDPDPGDITCVVPVKDRPGALGRLLETLRGTFETIVVDDASDDGTTITAVAVEHRARVIRLPHNLGPAGARNAGLAAVRTPYVLFVDSDIRIGPEAVLLLGRHLGDPGLAMVAPRIIGDGTHPTRLSAYETAHSALDLGGTGGLVRPRSPVGWLPAACLLARTEALGAGFDPSMRVGEDVDLVWRLVQDGRRVRYEPSVTALHDPRTSLRAWLGRRTFYGTSGALLAARHGGDVAPAAFSPLGAATAVAVLVQRRWSMAAVLGLSATTAVRLRRRLRQTPAPTRLAVELSARGVGSVAEQLTGLLLRHWWPLTVIGMTRSSRLRRAALVAALADTAIAYRRTHPALDPVSYAVLRRLDDLAYGAGLWAGAVRARSPRALLPRLDLPARRPPPPGRTHPGFGLG